MKTLCRSVLSVVIFRRAGGGVGNGGKYLFQRRDWEVLKDEGASGKVKVQNPRGVHTSIPGLDQQSRLSSDTPLPELIVQLPDPVGPGVPLLDHHVKSQESSPEDPGLRSGLDMASSDEEFLFE